MSAESAIRASLDELGPEAKWGWVIYRCTYADNDAAWARFRALVEQRSRARVARSDAPDLADRLDWVWVEDRAALDGASKESLRAHFRQWAAGQVAAQKSRGDFHPAAIPRYSFFVQVDDEALRSVAEQGSSDSNGRWPAEAHVNFVDANWKPLAELFPDMDASERGDDDLYDAVEGCREENVGWMRISPNSLSAGFYDVWCGEIDIWHSMYRRPPITLDY